MIPWGSQFHHMLPTPLSGGGCWVLGVYGVGYGGGFGLCNHGWYPVPLPERFLYQLGADWVPPPPLVRKCGVGVYGDPPPAAQIWPGVPPLGWFRVGLGLVFPPLVCCRDATPTPPLTCLAEFYQGFPPLG